MKKVHGLTNILFLIMVFFIGLIAVYDTIISIVLGSTLDTTELNPLCLHIIRTYGLPTFILIKSASAIIVTCICVALIYTKYRIAVFFVFLFQVSLFYFLSFYSSTSDDGNFLTPMDLFVGFYGSSEPYQDTLVNSGYLKESVVSSDNNKE